MKVELDNDEAWNLASHVIGLLIEEGNLGLLRAVEGCQINFAALENLAPTTRHFLLG